MKKLLMILALLAAAIVALGYGFASYHGMMDLIEVAEEKVGPIEMIYHPHQGSYGDLGTSWAEFRSKLKNAGVEECTAVAVYLDSPDTPDEEKRTLLGCSIDGLTAETRVKLRGLFNHLVMPAAQGFTGEFAFRSEISYWLGAMKVYPSLTERLTEGLTPLYAIEFYEEALGRIRYFIPGEAVPAGSLQPAFDAFSAAGQ